MNLGGMGDMIGKLGSMLGTVAPIIVYVVLAVILFQIVKKKFFDK